MRVIRFPDGTYKDDTKAANSDLCGTGGAAGKVEGEALVLPEFDPAAEYEDKILITQQTDPGWTLIFGSLKGVVTEHGNPLSHAAIVARELGIPACLGVDNATQEITTGDQIQIDGTTGNVIKV
jgi:pyruvate,water dikinase